MRRLLVMVFILGAGCRGPGAEPEVERLKLELDQSNMLVKKLEADMKVFVDQLEVQLAQIDELSRKLDGYRAKLVHNVTLGSRFQAAMERVTQLEKQLAETKDK